MAGRRLLTPRQVETEYGIKRETLHGWRKAEKGPAFIKLGHRTLYYDAAVLDEYLQRNTHIPSVRATIEEKRVSL